MRSSIDAQAALLSYRPSLGSLRLRSPVQEMRRETTIPVILSGVLNPALPRKGKEQNDE